MTFHRDAKIFDGLCPASNDLLQYVGEIFKPALLAPYFQPACTVRLAGALDDVATRCELAVLHSVPLLIHGGDTSVVTATHAPIFRHHAALLRAMAAAAAFKSTGVETGAATFDAAVDLAVDNGSAAVGLSIVVGAAALV